MDYDLIIIGGGHNGLTTAALQAKRGRRVLVLERRAQLGGLAAGREFHDGYHSIGILHDTAAVRESVIQALALESHGLRRGSTPASVFAPQVDGPGLLLAADPQLASVELRAHSAVDAARYVEFCAFQRRIGGYLRRLLNEAPPDIMPRGCGQYWDLLRKGWALRGLGRETMYECLRIAPMGLTDYLDEWFETDLLKALLAGPGLLGSWTGPRAAGTTALLLMQQCTAGREVIGGPAGLITALARACVAHRVETRCGVGVRRILVEGGRAVGVELDDGAVFRAPRIASSVDPRQTFLDLLAPVDLPVGLEAPMLSWRCRGTTAKLDLALDGPLEFSCRPGVQFESVRIGESLNALERAFDPVKYRQLPAAPQLDLRVPTVSDPSLAPPGHHVVSMLVQFVPHDLEGGWTELRRAELLELALARLAAFAPGCRDRMVGLELFTPVDLAREFGLSGGHVHHGEPGLDQQFSLRPHARCARYATPLPGLYLCGSGSHPGGGITCAPGELAAAAIG